MCKSLLVLFLLSLSYGSSAEIFTWVDDVGRKHFGDTVPEEYREQSDTVKPNIRTLTVEEKHAEKLKKRENAKSFQRAVSFRGSQKRNAERKTENDLMSINRKKIQIKTDSASCYASCRVATVSGGWNNAACGHCR